MVDQPLYTKRFWYLWESPEVSEKRRLQPCQGWGRGFESLRPLQFPIGKANGPPTGAAVVSGSRSRYQGHGERPKVRGWVKVKLSAGRRTTLGFFFRGFGCEISPSTLVVVILAGVSLAQTKKSAPFGRLAELMAMSPMISEDPGVSRSEIF